MDTKRIASDSKEIGLVVSWVADLIIERRTFFLSGILLLTLFFLYQAVTKLTVRTIFADLLPRNHEYVNLHNEIRDKFGGANQVLIMVQVRDKEDGGQYENIFNVESLNIVKSITHDLLTFHAVDRYKITSIASRKTRTFKITSSGYVVSPVMFPHVPVTKEGLEELRKTIYGTPWCYPALVSLDSKKALVMVDFFEDQIDYKICFRELRDLRKKYENSNNIIAIAGEPMHLGYIHSYVKDVLKILTYTVIAMMIVFYFYFRSKRGMLLPILAAAVSAIWGLGFLSMMGFNLDPLVLVFPFLIAAMAASHSVQVIKRFHEDAVPGGDAREACRSVIKHLLKPSHTGIITDASGIIIIALTPIPILQKITLSCAFWALATIVVAMILVPVLLSYMPVQVAGHKVGKKGRIVGLILLVLVPLIHLNRPLPHTDWLMICLLLTLIPVTCFLGSGRRESSPLDKTLRATGNWLVGWGKYPVLGVSLTLLVCGSFYVNDIDIGSNTPGSELLWPWHRYNVDSLRITFAMPMLNPLYVVLEGSEDAAVATPPCIRDIKKFIRYMKETPGMRVLYVQSIIEQIPGRAMVVRDNNPNWYFLPSGDSQLMLLYRQILFQSEPGAYDKYVDTNETTMNIVVFCRDKTAETIRIVMDRVNEYIRNESSFGKRSTDVERHGFDKFVYWIDSFFRGKPPPIPEKSPIAGVPKVHYRLAGGAVGVQAAINETLTLYQIWTFILAITVVFVLCSIIFRSVLAGVIITIPLILSNVLVFALMVFTKPLIALTTATLPVSSVGIGLGVDYGIYLVSRIIEEHKRSGDLDQAIKTALGTTGKAIVYIATTLVCGIVFWFISMLMFQALMGLMLAIILLLNMLGALLIIPSFISLLKPKFVVGGE